jgi:putative FmdB family regulatory protein
MPIYEYRCSSCGSEHEALRRLSDPPLATCPSCRKDTLTKLVSAAGFQLKGSGWYATDFKNGSKPAAKTDGKTETKTETKTDGRSDGKTDGGTTESKPAESKSEASTSVPAASSTKP